MTDLTPDQRILLRIFRHGVPFAYAKNALNGLRGAELWLRPTDPTQPMAPLTWTVYQSEEKCELNVDPWRLQPVSGKPIEPTAAVLGREGGTIAVLWINEGRLAFEIVAEKEGWSKDRVVDDLTSADAFYAAQDARYAQLKATLRQEETS